MPNTVYLFIVLYYLILQFLEMFLLLKIFRRIGLLRIVFKPLLRFPVELEHDGFEGEAGRCGVGECSF